LAHSLSFTSAVGRAKNQSGPAKPGSNYAEGSLQSLRLFKPARGENRIDPAKSLQSLFWARSSCPQGKFEKGTEHRSRQWRSEAGG
jgi:hypothetical protein